MNALLTAESDSLLDDFPDALIWVAPNGRVEHQNHAAAELLSQALVGRAWSDCIAKYFAPSPNDGHEVSLHDGRLVSLRTQARSEGGQLIIMTDLTPSREWQSKRAHQARLAELGQMSASLAHQIKTPLATCLLYSEMLQDSSLEPGQIQRFAQRLNQSLTGLSEQVHELLNYSRGELALTDRVSVQSLIDEWQALTRQTLAREQEWTMQIASGDVQCAKRALTGAFMNLIQNARQIAGERGIDLKLAIGAQMLNGKLLIRVIDNAGGLGDLSPSDATEPFVSKRAGGTGLGLAVANGILMAHGGKLSLQPIPGGLCATLEVPLL